MNKRGLVLMILAAAACGASDPGVDGLAASEAARRERELEMQANAARASDNVDAATTAQPDAAIPRTPSEEDDSICETVHIKVGKVGPGCTDEICTVHLGSEPWSSSVVTVKLNDELLAYRAPNGWTLDLDSSTLTLQGSTCAALCGVEGSALSVEVKCSHPIAL